MRVASWAALFVAAAEMIHPNSSWSRDKDGETPMIALADLKSPDLEVRRAAAEKLIDLAISSRSERAVRENLKELVDIVGNKRLDPEVRREVVRAIAIISERKRIDQTAVPALIKVLLDDQDDERIRNWIAISLPDLADPEAAAPAILRACRVKNRNVRENAAEQIGRVGLAPDKLLSWTERTIADPDPAMRTAALDAAVSLCRKKRRAVEVILLALADRDRIVRNAAIRSVLSGEILGTSDTVGRKEVEKLLTDPQPAIAMSAAAALMQIAPDEKARYLGILIKGLQSERAPVREAAAQVLALKGPEAAAAVSQLKKTINDSNELVRVHSAMALANITEKHDPYRDILQELGRSQNGEVMLWAKTYLGILLSEEEQYSRKEQIK